MDYTERIDPDDNVVAALARHLIGLRSDLDCLRRMTEILGWATMQARHAPSRRPSLRRGDFGEALSIALQEEFEGRSVPVPKLRYQIDPEQTMPGTDIVAFEWRDDGRLADLHFVESKLRTVPDTDAAAKAHEQLVADQSLGFADIIGFIGGRLASEQPALFEAFLIYLADRTDPDKGSYGVSLTWEAQVWSEAVLANIPEPPEQLDPLTVTVTHISRLAELVERVYAHIGVELIDDDG